MSDTQLKTIHRALISVYHKEGLLEILELLVQHGVEIVSTGGTAQWIREQGFSCTDVENLTGYPSILGGRVKTLHPAVFGGILGRRHVEEDRKILHRYEIPWIDLVVVDLYPFEETLNSGAAEEEILEKIDVGGVALIRAAAKNHRDVVVVPSRNDYAYLLSILRQRNYTTAEERQRLARRAFAVTAAYDTAIGAWLGSDEDVLSALPNPGAPLHALRYGENPHQKGWFLGNLAENFDQLSGKELSYNNLLDLDSGYAFLEEFYQPVWVIIKHNNPCGLATSQNPTEAFDNALKADSKSAFGGVFLTNRPVPVSVAEKLKDFFFEILSAPDYEEEALDILSRRSQRILLRHKTFRRPSLVFRSALNGFLIQELDKVALGEEHLRVVTNHTPDEATWQDLRFAWKVVRHVRSNAIVLARHQMVVGVGAGHTARIDALRHALLKAQEAGLDTCGAVLASEAFFPFADSVEMAAKAGISAIIQPGGSVRDHESIEACNRLGLAMVFTGHRHFRH
ncbi:MAG: bifunctional phosphoribosylaminoimidazolecarboxamide formyltransferase/IMP cyclohydrolase [Flavobacteriales bacterium]|nr:bifunctional phosphoribosylaminoimidazolecarboxamide formyltransferase/IMP cyclohydrolase [Flavobacteriales bacterium]MCX7768844.1 bifunctional phosphoribosylaminoimidazolecarboxamide formyltransferase/IMP cyclohydrolase [Flavobacteriales bacterium]MDW8410514.1 bifunctional phosphoribosylaminoimidazolecarboxamide formyltransferase/IMP cyclohydrolase [Flavobacteriales bacterium]